jgi:hypothetical protein
MSITHTRARTHTQFRDGDVESVSWIKIMVFHDMTTYSMVDSYHLAVQGSSGILATIYQTTECP